MLNTKDNKTIQELITELTKPKLPGPWVLLRSFETEEDNEALIIFVPELDANIIVLREYTTNELGEETYSLTIV